MLPLDFLEPCAGEGVQAILLADENTWGPVTPVINSQPTTGGVSETILDEPVLGDPLTANCQVCE